MGKVRASLCSRDDRKLALSLGGQQLSAVVDQDGMPSHEEVAIGGMTMTLERVFLRGTLP